MTRPSSSSSLMSCFAGTYAVVVAVSLAAVATLLNPASAGVEAFSSCSIFSSPRHPLVPSPFRLRRDSAVVPPPVASSSSSSSSTSSTRLLSSATPGDGGSGSGNDDDVLGRVASELRELAECASLAYGYVSRPDGDVSAEDVVLACDAVDDASITDLSSLRRRAHEFGRYHLLVKMLRRDYDAYVATAEFLSPSRIAREDLPNVQDVAYNVVAPQPSNPGGSGADEAAEEGAEKSMKATAASSSTTITGEDGQPLVVDCELDDLSYDDSPLDKLLLSIFRNLVAKNTGGVTSDISGIEGLLDQGRRFMTKELPEGVSYADHAEAQHAMVKNTLGGLMTPVLPPFYRIFMTGIVPKLGSEWDGKQLGPWFYAPYLTSIVTPTFFGFLVGPSRPNRRSDGGRGGLVVEKCKFLQESGCKGLCLHQCKVPAQEFFREELGLDLTVKPNFVTQECQWSFGEVPLPPEEDPSFPTGCLVGCDSRKAMAGRKSDALCM